MTQPMSLSHPVISRRTAIQAGAVGLLGLGSNHLEALRAAGQAPFAAAGKAKTCIYIFLSGGLAQHESFDLKPDAPSGIRGEFNPIATSTPDIEITEHLPGLAKRSHLWSLVRSLTHPTNGHTLGHYFMLTGQSVRGNFRGDRVPRATDAPSIASIVGDAVPASTNNLPPSIVLPDRLVHWSGGVIPGLYGGMMGRQHDPLFIEASPYGDPMWKGAFPTHSFYGRTTIPKPDERVFQAPSIQLPQGLNTRRLSRRLKLLDHVDAQVEALTRSAESQNYDAQRQRSISMLADPKVRRAFDVTTGDDTDQDRYGRNSFGWSLLMAKRLVEADVNLIQVNLGNNETWDTHSDAFHRLKDKLLPPTDKGLCALLDDLAKTGRLDSTLIVMAGEFGRTPEISSLGDGLGPGRNHWGAVQTVFFAGGGIRGGTVIGSSDADGAYPATSPQKPENMAATIYNALGIPPTAVWKDQTGRPHHVYNGEPIPGLT